MLEIGVRDIVIHIINIALVVVPIVAAIAGAIALVSYYRKKAKNS